ncbi:putative Ankyrin repeats (3 copies)/Zinc finger, C3HC4 type (RING finger) [Trypanosoma cruzi]|nr:putative Ankyrin repeats (3 copies)/Zinc finger, C3HC4 type (RING finger) [Trypanosoma cruzi]
MEFQYAAVGNTAALRAWLQHHPERVNIPSPGSRYTLLTTAVKRGHLDTVHMLVGEFHADLGIPCGGIDNTCVHAAASNCDVEMLSYLLACRAPLKPNAFMEYPSDIAKVATAASLVKEKCIAMLRAHEGELNPHGLKQEGKEGGQPQPMQWRSPLESVVSPTSLRDVISDVKLTGDEDGKEEDVQRRSLQELPMQGAGTAIRTTESLTTITNGVNGNPEDKSRGNASRVRPRNARNIKEEVTLPLDIHTFRRMYGNGFDFIESTHAYFIRGLLPYNFKGNVYYTPVVLILRKTIDAEQEGDESSQQAYHISSSSSSSGGPSRRRRIVSRYGALIDRKRLGDLFINRRATYIDPCTAAIIPSEADAYYKNLLCFLRHAVLDNFERIPPLTPSVDENRGVQDNLPLFRLYPREREVSLRILRDLSRFCDGVFTYDSATLRVEGFLPLFMDLPTPPREGGFSASDRALAKTASCPKPHPHNSPGTTLRGGEEEVVATDLIMKLPLRVQFSANSNFEDPPRVYFLSATTSSPETRTNYDFLSKIIVDSSVGEVRRGTLSSLEKWNQHGSLLSVLSELQQKATSLLMEYCQASALSFAKGGSEAATTQKIDSYISTTPLNPTLCGTGSVGSTSVECDMDWLLVGHPTVRNAPDLFRNTSPTSKHNFEEMSTANVCVICLEAGRNVVLLPCRHLVLCLSCSLRYKDHLADEMLCPICRIPIVGMLEIFP